MNIVTVLVTRSKSCHVKTLHSVLKLNIRCIHKNISNEIVYVDDDPYKKADVVQKCMKKCDRIICIDFGIGVDDASLDKCFEKHDGIGGLVFPGVKEGVDWEMFEQKRNDDVDEPVTQMVLHVNTNVNKKGGKDI